MTNELTNELQSRWNADGVLVVNTDDLGEFEGGKIRVGDLVDYLVNEANANLEGWTADTGHGTIRNKGGWVVFYLETSEYAERI